MLFMINNGFEGLYRVMSYKHYANIDHFTYRHRSETVDDEQDNQMLLQCNYTDACYSDGN